MAVSKLNIHANRIPDLSTVKRNNRSIIESEKTEIQLMLRTHSKKISLKLYKNIST